MPNHQLLTKRLIVALVAVVAIVLFLFLLLTPSKHSVSSLTGSDNIGSTPPNHNGHIEGQMSDRIFVGIDAPTKLTIHYEGTSTAHMVLVVQNSDNIPVDYILRYSAPFGSGGGSTDAIPMSVDENNFSGGSCRAWDCGSINAGDTAWVNITVMPSSPGAFTSKVYVIPSNSMASEKIKPDASFVADFIGNVGQ